MSGVTRAARGHAPLFIINEGEDRGKGQWGERKRAAGTHAQKKRKEKGGRRERRRRDLLEGEERRGERDRRGGGRKGGEKGERRERRYRERGNSNIVGRGSNTIAGRSRSSRRSDRRGVVCGSGLGVCNSATGGGK